MKSPTLGQQLLAEGLGTFTLTLVVMASMAVRTPAFPTPVLAALTLAVCVFTLGKISGTHINPAVSLGLASINKMSLEKALKYVVVQVIGALVAYFFVQQFFPGFKLPTAARMTSAIGIGEVLGTALFTFGIASVALRQKVESMTASFVIGTSLLLGIVLAAPLSLGVLNPAIAISMKLYAWQYILAPVVGSIIGFGAYRYISSE